MWKELLKVLRPAGRQQLIGQTIVIPELDDFDPDTYGKPVEVVVEGEYKTTNFVTANIYMQQYALWNTRICRPCTISVYSIAKLVLSNRIVQAKNAENCTCTKDNDKINVELKKKTKIELTNFA